MPNNNGDITFKYGTQEAYNGLSSTDENAIYITTDTHRIYIGGADYTNDTQMNNATKQYIDNIASIANSRVDNIITHNNDTDGNSELIDIRTGTDGIAYCSAGTAVRDQINQVDAKVNQICSFNENIIDFRTAAFAITGYRVSISEKTKMSFIMKDNLIEHSTREFYGFGISNLIAGHTYTVNFSFSNDSTFHEDYPYYINVMSNTNLTGSQLGRSTDTQTGSFTFTAASENCSLRFITVYGCEQKVTCTIVDNSSEIALKRDFSELLYDMIENYISHSSSWKGKSWLAYGDSITQISNGNSLDAGWAKYVNEEMGFSHFYGRGVGGQTYVWNNKAFQANQQTGEYISRNTENDNCRGCFCSWQRISTMIPDSIKDDIDLIWLMGGTNDISNVEEVTGQSVIEYTKPVFIENQGTDTDWQNAEEYNGGDYDITTFSGAIASTIMKLQYRCPNAIIVVSTPMPRWYTDTFHPTTTQQTEIYQNGEHHGVTTVDVADVEIKVARYMSVPYYDVNSMSCINGFNWSRYMVGVHPETTAGKKMLARTIIGALRSVEPIISE